MLWPSPDVYGSALTKHTQGSPRTRSQLLQRAEGVRVGWPDSKHLPEFAHGIITTALPLECQREAAMSVHVIRIEANCLSELRDRVVEPPLRRECDSQVVVCVHELRLEADRFPELTDRVIELALSSERRAEIAVRLGELR